MLDEGEYPSFVARRSVASEDIVSSDEEFDVLVEMSFLDAGNFHVVGSEPRFDEFASARPAGACVLIVAQMSGGP